METDEFGKPKSAKVGDRVVILYDDRSDMIRKEDATGKVAIFSGEKPHTYVVSSLSCIVTIPAEIWQEIYEGNTELMAKYPPVDRPGDFDKNWCYANTMDYVRTEIGEDIFDCDAYWYLLDDNEDEGDVNINYEMRLHLEWLIERDKAMLTMVEAAVNLFGEKSNKVYEIKERIEERREMLKSLGGKLPKKVADQYEQEKRDAIASRKAEKDGDIWQKALQRAKQKLGETENDEE